MEGSFALNPTRPVTASARSHINSKLIVRSLWMANGQPSSLLATTFSSSHLSDALAQA